MRNLEAGLAGAVLIDAQTVIPIAERYLTSEDFYYEVYRNVYTSASELVWSGNPVDANLIMRQMDNPNIEALVECMNLAPVMDNVEVYCIEVKKDSIRRQIQSIAQEIVEENMDAVDPMERIQRLQDQLRNMSIEEDDDLVSGAEAVEAFSKNYHMVKDNPLCGLCPTGFKDLDELCGGGFRNGQLYLVGARPGMGKTTFALNIADKIAAAGKRVLFVSLEMTALQLTTKRISRIASIGFHTLINAKADNAQEERAEAAKEKIAELPVTVTNRSGRTVQDIRSLVRRSDFDIVIIDYLGLIAVPKEEMQKPKYEQVSNISRQLKLLTKDLNKPMIVLCQLNREAASSGKSKSPPTIDNLRDSGSLEQDADDVWLLHRPEYYTASNDPLVQSGDCPESFEVHIGKSRYGQAGRVAHLSWYPAFGLVTEKQPDENRSDKETSV